MSEFGYDYASRRAFTREYDFANGGWSNPQITRRVFDGLDVVQERNTTNYLNAQLVRDGNIGGILARTTADGPAFYGYDGNGNVTLLTNSAGQDVGHYRYDAFGNTLEATGPRAGENPYRFSTKELHGPSGLYDYGLRFYSPGMGRWLNRDPLEEEGGVNLYGFVGNNPINDVDEYGLHRWDGPRELDPGVGGGSHIAIRPTFPEVMDSIGERGMEVAKKSVEGLFTVAAIVGAGAMLGKSKGVRPPANKALPTLTKTTKALPAFTKTTVGKMMVSSRLPKGKTSRGASLLAKRVADGLMSGVKPTQANADKILRDVLNNPLRTRATQRTGQMDAIGRSFNREVGVRINTRTGEFIGFRTPDF